MPLYIFKRDGVTFAGAYEGDTPGGWYSANRLDPAEYPAEMVDEIDCHDVTPYLDAIAMRLGVTAEFTFVPLSKSRHATPGPDGKVWTSLNWRVTISRGKQSFAVDYAQGSGGAPAMKRKAEDAEARRLRERAAAAECETGICHRFGHRIPAFQQTKPGIAPEHGRKAVPPPPLGDVLHSLAHDADVLDFPSFEAWAAELGYSDDSISAKATYEACLSQTLALRSMVGEAAMTELQTVARFN